MGDVKWVKFEVGMYDDIKLKILDQMDNRDLNQYVWARSVVLAGKINRGGYLYITDNIPYSIKTLAIEFNRSIEEIKSAFKILRKLEMIEFTADNFSDDENKDSSEKSNRNNLSQADDIENQNINNQDVVKLLTYYESITGILSGLNIGFLKLAIDAHGYK